MSRLESLTIPRTVASKSLCRGENGIDLDVSSTCALEESGAWMREAPKPVRRRAAPAIKAWKLPTQRRWMLLHDGQEVVGPVRQWVRETLQNSYSLQYLTSQSAGLYTRGAEAVVRVGDVLLIDGAALELG